MQAVVFQTEEESACCRAKDVVSGYITVFPRKRANVFEYGIALLTGGDQDGRGRGARGEGLRFRLLDLWSWGGGFGAWSMTPSINSVHKGGEVSVITKLVIHG